MSEKISLDSSELYLLKCEKNSAFYGLRGRDLLTTYLSGIAKWMAKKWTDASIPYLNRKRSQCVFLLRGKI